MAAGAVKSPATIVAIACHQVRVPVLQEWAASPEFGGQPIGPEKLILKLTDSDGFDDSCYQMRRYQAPTGWHMREFGLCSY